MTQGGIVAGVLAAATLANQTPSKEVRLPPQFIAAESAIGDVCLPIVESDEISGPLVAAAGFRVESTPPEFVRNLIAGDDVIYRSEATGEAIYLVIERAPTSAAKMCAVSLAGSDPAFMDSLRRRFVEPRGRFVEDAGNTWPALIVSLQAGDKVSGRFEKIVAAAGADPKSGLMRTSAAVLRVDPPSNEAEVQDVKRRCSEGQLTSALLCGNHN